MRSSVTHRERGFGCARGSGTDEQSPSNCLLISHTFFHMHTLSLPHTPSHTPTQGGNYVDLHKMLGVKSGTEVMYVGDHIYGDILRSKKVTVGECVGGGLVGDPFGLSAQACLWIHQCTIES